MGPDHCGHYPSTPDGVSVQWDSKPRTIEIGCSRTRPYVSWTEDGKKASDDLLLNSTEAEGVSGAEESIANMYFVACHSYFGGYENGIRKFSYDVNADNS